MLVEEHETKYWFVSRRVRLACLGYSRASFNQLKKSVRDRIARESSIPYEDYLEAVKQILEYPYLGGQKGALKLLSEKKALIGATFYQEIKKQIKLLAEEEYQARKQLSELEKNQYARSHEKRKEFEKMQAKQVDDIWAIDFVELWLLGVKLVLCVVYDVYSQSYLAILPGENATEELASRAIIFACSYRKSQPRKCIISDGGKQFDCASFDNKLKDKLIFRNQTPPGEPWYNGALESGNRDLKKVIYTIAFYKACDNPSISKKGVSRNRVFNFLKLCCNRALYVINDEIVRPKFNCTPRQVIEGHVNINNLKMQEFKAKKKAERKVSIAMNGNKKNKEDKVKDAWKFIKPLLQTDNLFAFIETINERYRAFQV